MSTRPLQEIAAELAKEMDSAKLATLVQELDEAFKERDRNMAALLREHPPENVSRRLLFVDDETSIRATLPVILRQRGFDVTVAASVPEAIQKIQNHEFDALLSDLNIGQPGGGYAVVRAIRRVNPDCVAIILTGDPAFESAVEGIQEKIDDYIVKPANIDLVVASMERGLAERHALHRHVNTSTNLTISGTLVVGQPPRSE